MTEGEDKKVLCSRRNVPDRENHVLIMSLCWGQMKTMLRAPSPVCKLTCMRVCGVSMRDERQPRNPNTLPMCLPCTVSV